jgi:hypothetical protein
MGKGMNQNPNKPCRKCGKTNRFASGECRPCKAAYDASYRATHKRDKAAYKTTRYQTNIQYRITEVLRARIAWAVKQDSKVGSAVRDLGCSIHDFKIYIETLWTPGMNWDNWGLKGWHMDHIIPLSFFDLTDREQFLKACHYTNLQPLWAKDNLSKGGKYDFGNVDCTPAAE